MEERRRKARLATNVVPKTVFFNTNSVDQLAKVDRSTMLQLEKLQEQSQLVFCAPKGVLLELNHPKTPAVVREMAPDIYTIDVQLTNDEQKLLNHIKAIFRGNSLSSKHNSDAEHVFEAIKYGATIFVTSDKRIMKRVSLVAPQIQLLDLQELLQTLAPS